MNTGNKKTMSLQLLNMEMARKFFFGVLTTINAVFTYQFASFFLVNIVSSGGRITVVTPIIAGLLAMAVSDLASLVWRYIYIHSGSMRQRQISKLMSTVSIIISSVATFAQIVFNSSSLVDLSAYHSFVGVVALFGFGFLIVGHFIAAMYYEVSSNEIRELELMQEQQALISDQALSDMTHYLSEIKNEMAAGMAWQLRNNVIRQNGYDPEQFLAGAEEMQASLLQKPQKKLTDKKGLPVITEKLDGKYYVMLQEESGNWVREPRSYTLSTMTSAFERVANLRKLNPKSNSIVVNSANMPVDLEGNLISYTIDYTDNPSTAKSEVSA